MQVLTGGTADRPLLATARTPITLGHLFTHTAGFYYDFIDDPVLSEVFKRAKLDQSADLEEFVKRAAALPLKHQPGEAYTYGINTSILGRVIEVISGQPFGQFLQSRIFEPLGMRDTGFSVPAEKRDRLARIYRHEDGELVATEATFASWPEEGRGPELGGAGLFSTIGDYARFAQMLLNGGELEGRRILGRKTVQFMRTDRLAHLAEPHIGARAQGFGLGVSVVVDVGQSPAPASLGRFGWSGAATTDCGIDPEEHIVALVLTQHFPFNEHRLFERFTTGYMQALVD
jgi:CubicO group peptidase (beta-lactamase class C family)